RRIVGVGSGEGNRVVRVGAFDVTPDGVEYLVAPRAPPKRVRSDCPHRTLPESSGSDSQDREVHGLSRSPALTRSVLGAACPPHFKTIGRLHHCSSSLNFGISREFLSNFANRSPRDSSDHCSTN